MGQQNGDGDAPQVAPILVEVAEDFDCATEGVFQDPDDCSRYFACNIKAGNSNLASQFVAYAIDCPPGLAFSERADGKGATGPLREAVMVWWSLSGLKMRMKEKMQ